MSNEQEIEIDSPCVGVCSMDETTGFCLGCYRTLEEIQGWWDLSNAEKKTVIEATAKREQSAFD
jgi:predicted Fe-S protein YdhL (DUF1289 family)